MQKSKYLSISLLTIITLSVIVCSMHKSEPYNLKVLIIEDTRFPNIADQDYENIFSTTSTVADKIFSIKVNLQRTDKINLSDFLEKHKIAVNKKIDLFANPQQIYKEQLMQYCKKEKESISMFLSLKGQENCETIVDHIISLFSKKLEIIKSETINNVHIINKDAPENSYVFWENVAKGITKYDIIIINSLIMDDFPNDIFSPAVHTLIRGGVTTGGAFKSRSLHKGTVVFSIFPFVVDIQPFSANENTPKQHRNNIIAHYIMHELGHMLMYYPDNYNDSKCLMHPAKNFDYYNWFLQVKDGSCKKPDKRTIKFIKKYYQS